MTFVTKLTLRGGDQAVLDETVDEIATFVSRKGAELKGPHPKPPTKLRVPLYRTLAGGEERFPDWEYTVYTRHIEIVGHDAVARAVAERDLPPSVFVSITVEQVNSPR